ncbi:nicotinamidase-related amidase [Pullulanibacillus pueri]|uniref:Putative isochorismatase family protein n=1 Tax=Pullulanibacillus pueri TaxID=1437324 RepID=A0A8J2ZRP1_9BACL|nr:isochorismatase family protein [Pullulanibacillus pueri]MBM7680045.1 nicotinamidase-related amidase [Pullulanibacillus pueri]GGH74092.1 putative isochorismatase family protein [Pullulanibacillus pueri]
MTQLFQDPKKTALVVIDLQKGIVAMNSQPYEVQEVVQNNVKLAEALRAKGGLVTLVHVDFLDGQDALKPVTDASASSSGERPEGFSEILPELGPHEGDLVITKRQWGAFFGTELDLQLRRRGIDTIILTGIATGIGVDTTAREAFQRNYQQIFVQDAMNGITQEEHEYTVNHVLPKMGRVRTTAEVLDALK